MNTTATAQRRHIPHATLETLKERVDLVAVIGRHVDLRRQGRDLVGLCPFHQERTPSFTVTPGSGLWHCFGCGAGGDAIKFLELVERRDFMAVVRELAQDAGVDLESGQDTAPRPAAPRAAPRVLQAERTDWPKGESAATWERLCSSADATPVRTWLEVERKVPAWVPLYCNGGAAVAYATLDNLEAWPLHVVDAEKGTTARQWVGSMLRWQGPAAVVPVSNARTGDVEELRLRFLAPKDAKKWGKPISVRGMSSHAEDGTPRGYGMPAFSLLSPVVVLCEGMADTLTAQALRDGRSDVVAMGAAASGELERRWAPHLAARAQLRQCEAPDAPRNTVVILAHLDRPADAKQAAPTADGTGQDAAKNVRAELLAAGVNAEVFRWGTFLECLASAGVPRDVLARDVKDLNDAAKACAAHDVPWDTLRGIFLYTLLEHEETQRG